MLGEESAGTEAQNKAVVSCERAFVGHYGLSHLGRDRAIKWN